MNVIVVIGAGGLGSPCLQYLTAAGVGALTIIDDDEVALSNLQRQTLFTTAAIGRPKVAVAAEQLRALNPHVAVTPLAQRLTTENAAALLAGHSLIIDGCDSFATRLAVNAAAIALGIPLLSGAVGPFDGQIALFAGHRPDQPCYQCLVGAAADRPEQSCAETGVLGALTGIIGSMLALEALRAIIGFGDPLAGRLLLYDALGARLRSVRLPKDPGCRACG